MKEQIKTLIDKVVFIESELKEIQLTLIQVLQKLENKEEIEQVQLEKDKCISQDIELINSNVEKNEIEEPQIGSQVLQFFELRTMKEKLDYLKYKMDWKEITENELSMIGISMDIVLQEGTIDCKIRDLISYVEKIAQWEIKGMRG